MNIDFWHGFGSNAVPPHFINGSFQIHTIQHVMSLMSPSWSFVAFFCSALSYVGNRAPGNHNHQLKGKGFTLQLHVRCNSNTGPVSSSSCQMRWQQPGCVSIFTSASILKYEKVFCHYNGIIIYLNTSGTIFIKIS